MFKTADGVKWQEQTEEVYLIHYNQDVFEANGVAIRIIELSQQIPRNIQEIVEILSKEYEVAREILENDVTIMVAEFQKLGILKEVKNGSQ